jgi:hypothetical protein
MLSPINIADFSVISDSFLHLLAHTDAQHTNAVGLQCLAAISKRVYAPLPRICLRARTRGTAAPVSQPGLCIRIRKDVAPLANTLLLKLSETWHAHQGKRHMEPTRMTVAE